MVEAYNRRVRVKGLDADDLGRKVRELETEKIAEMREEQRAQDEAEGMDGDEDEDEEEKDAETLEAELAALEKRTAELLAKHQAAWQPQPVAPVPAPAPAKKKEDKESAAKKSQKNKRNAAIVDKVVSAAAASKKKKLAAAAIDKEVTLSKSKLATAAIDKEVTPSKGKLTAAAIDKEITPSKSKLAAATIDKAITTPKGKSSAVPAAAVNSNASTVKPRVKHGSTLLTSTIRLPTIKKQKVSESAAKTTASAKSNDHASVYATPAQKKNHWDAVDDVKDAPAAGQKKNHWDAVDEEKTAPVAASRTKKHWEMDVDTETSVEPVANERRLSNNWFSGGNSTTTIASSGTSTDSIKKPASLLSAFSGQALPFGSALAPKPPSPTKEQQTRAMFFPAIKPRVMKPVRQPIPINTEERRQETEDELIQMLGLSGSTSILRRPMMLDRMDEDPVQTRDEGGASADSARKAVQDQTADLNWGAGGDDNWMAVDTPAQPEQVVAPAAVADEPVQKPVMDATSPVKRHWDWSPAKDTPTDPVEVKPEIENRVAKEDVNHVQSRNDDDVLPKARFSPLRPSTHIQLNAQVDHVSVVHADPRHRSRDETLPDTASMSSTSNTPRLEREPVPSVDPVMNISRFGLVWRGCLYLCAFLANPHSHMSV